MKNNFIKATDTYADFGVSVPAPYIRRAFTLDFKPESAKLRIAVSGFYELYINGVNVTKGFLAPYISNPDNMLLYDEYEVAEHLNEGANAIGFILGNGFANQCTEQWNFSSASFRAPLCASVELIASTDVKSFRLTSDESFKTHPSPIIFDMYRYGTHYDARLEIPGWATADIDDSSWKNVLKATAPKGVIMPCTANPIRLVKELTPVNITYQKDICYLKTALYGGEDIPFTRTSGYLYDFGKSCAGVCKLKIKGEAGQMVTLRHGERLADDGSFNINSIYTFKDDYEKYIHLFQADVYTLKGGETEIFIPMFTYHGFRYVFVEGITEDQATPELLTFEVISSVTAPRSGFVCSDKTLNTLYEMAINADVSNFHYFPTDCPHREKNGWTGDISVSAEQLLLSFDCSEDLKTWLKTLAYAQKEDGSLPGIAPTGGWGFAWGNGPMWDSACVTLPYLCYKYDNRVDVLHQCSDMIYKYLRYVSSRRDERGLIAIGLGDWCEPRTMGTPITAPLVLTDSAVTYAMATKSAFIFSVTGETERQQYAKELASELKKSIREHLIDSTFTASGRCQTSQALLLANGLFEANEYEKAYAKLIEITKEKDWHSVCGMIGLTVIFEVLMQGGDADGVIDMLLQDTEPSYKSMILRGATSLCESLAENGLNESENHHFFGDIIRIFISYIAGLKLNPSLTDITEVIFSPTLTSRLDHAKGYYLFKNGRCDFGWERRENEAVAFIDLPSGISGSFVYKDTKLPLKTGHNEFKL